MNTLSMLLHSNPSLNIYILGNSISDISLLLHFIYIAQNHITFYIDKCIGSKMVIEGH